MQKERKQEIKLMAFIARPVNVQMQEDLILKWGYSEAEESLNVLQERTLKKQSNNIKYLCSLDLSQMKNIYDDIKEETMPVLTGPKENKEIATDKWKLHTKYLIDNNLLRIPKVEINKLKLIIKLCLTNAEYIKKTQIINNNK